MKKNEEANQGLFLWLAWFAVLLLLIVLTLLFYLFYPRLYQIHQYLPVIFGIIEILILIPITGGLLLITISVTSGKDLLYPHGKKQITVRTLFPIVLFLGQFLKISKDRIRSSYVAVNDSIIRVTRNRISADKILMLLPHCLQNHECPWKITIDIRNCHHCGKCEIGDLIKMAEHYGVDLRIATGGTIARKVAAELKPTAIIAVACQRDLTSGITDAYPIPVFGILNKRPNGPCYDTWVSLDKIEEAFEFFSRNKLVKRDHKGSDNNED
ncbi:DUF116 domain-containing protein [bacterium]|nr:DUF116 domain-containing protein [bacterium]